MPPTGQNPTPLQPVPQQTPVPQPMPQPAVVQPTQAVTSTPTAPPKSTEPAQQPMPSQQPDTPMGPAPVYGGYSNIAGTSRIPRWLVLSVASFIGFVVLVLVILVIISKVAGASSPQVQTVSDQLVAAIQADDSTQVYSLTTVGYKKATTIDKLSKTLSQISPALNGDEKVTGKKKIKIDGKPESFVILYEIDGQGGKQYLRVILEQEGDSWRVSNFNASDVPLELST